MLDTLKKLDNKVIQFLIEYIDKHYQDLPDNIWVESIGEYPIKLWSNVLNYLASLDDPKYSWLRWYSSNIEDIVERNNLWAIHGDWIDRVIDRVFKEYPKQANELNKNQKLIGFFLGKISEMSHGRIEGKEVIDYIYRKKVKQQC